MKKNREVIPTKFLPAGSKRITNANNERVWLINGMEFYSKNEYFQWRKDQQLATQAAQKNPAPKVEEPVTEEA